MKKIAVKNMLLIILVSLLENYPLDSAASISQVVMTSCPPEKRSPDLFLQSESAGLPLMITQFFGKDGVPDEEVCRTLGSLRLPGAKPATFLTHRRRAGAGPAPTGFSPAATPKALTRDANLVRVDQVGRRESAC